MPTDSHERVFELTDRVRELMRRIAIRFDDPQTEANAQLGRQLIEITKPLYSASCKGAILSHALARLRELDIEAPLVQQEYETTLSQIASAIDQSNTLLLQGVPLS